MPLLIDKNCQDLPSDYSMNSEDLKQQFLSEERARSPDTIIGILRKKLRVKSRKDRLLNNSNSQVFLEPNLLKKLIVLLNDLIATGYQHHTKRGRC